MQLKAPVIEIQTGASMTIEKAPVRAIEIIAAGKAAGKDLQGWFTRTAHDVHDQYARRRLTAKVSKILRIARTHQDNGLACGADEYKYLNARSLELVAEYCEQFDVDPEKLAIEMPALKSLERMTKVVDIQSSGLSKLMFFAITVVVSPVLLGLGGGLFMAVYHHVLHLLKG